MLKIGNGHSNSVLRTKLVYKYTNDKKILQLTYVKVPYF